MRSLIVRAALAAAIVVVGFAWAARAADAPVTLTGKIACAHCTLKEPDAKECQDVLVVEGENAGKYYLVKNDALKKFGHTCSGYKAARVTGVVTEKDGKKWLEATSIEKIKKAKG